MIKTYCDRCGKEIEYEYNKYIIRIERSEEIDFGNHLYFNDDLHLCPGCVREFAANFLHPIGVKK